MKSACLILTLALAFVLPTHAVEISSGLDYLRPGAPDFATLGKAMETGSVVLDLRYASDKTVTTTLSTLKGFRTHPKRIVLVLLSPETSSSARSQLVTRLPGCITIGRTDADYKTDIAVTTSAESDKNAFDALVAATSPEKLLVENADKVRFDEVTLAREHQAGAEIPAATPTETAKPEPSPADKTKSTPVDAVLQRAVQIHRGLVALKQL